MTKNKKVVFIAILAFILLMLVACSSKKAVQIDNIINIEENNTSNTNNTNTENTNNSINTDNTDNTDSNIDVVETFLDENNVVTNSDSIEVVVNKERNLASDYIPSDLVRLEDVPTCLANEEVNQLRKPAYDALVKMFSAAKDEINIQLVARSGYRSYNTQVALYNGYVQNHGQEEADKFSAKPGQSEHQTGLAMDITSEGVNLQLTENFGATDEGKWITQNAHKYGFIVRYPEGKENITGYMYEPWHVRFVGEDLAARVYESGKTLEQYLFGEE